MDMVNSLYKPSYPQLDISLLMETSLPVDLGRMWPVVFSDQDLFYWLQIVL